MSLLEINGLFTGPFKDSLTSRRNSDKFCVNLDFQNEYEDGKIVIQQQKLSLPVSIFGGDVPFNAIHQIVKPLGHKTLLVDRLTAND